MSQESRAKSGKFLVYTIGALLFAWIIYGKISSKNTKVAIEVEQTVVVQSVAPALHSSSINIPGILKPKGKLTVRSRTSGIVERVGVSSGDLVPPNTEIVVLEDHGRKALMDGALEVLNEKTKLYEINKELSKMGYYAKTNFYEKSSELATAKANYEVAKADYEDTMVRTPPVMTFIGSVEPDPGDSVSTGDALATLFPVDGFKVALYLSVTDVGKVNNGNKAKIILPNGEQVSEATVTKTEVIADPDNGMYEVDVTAYTSEEVSFPYKMLGSPARAVIETNPSMLLEVPGSALSLSDEGALGIKVVEQGKVVFIPVKIERSSATSFLLSGEGLTEDTLELIVRGAGFVKAGSKVKTVKHDETTP